MPGFTYNYTGRIVDLSVVQELKPDGLVEETLDFANPAEVVAGPQKAVQAWAIHFLTRRGTVAGDTDYGTTFMTNLMQNSLLDDMDVEQEFTAAAQDIRNYQVERSADSDHDDEVVTSATLLTGWDFDRQAGKLDLRVGLTLKSGKLVEVLLPIPVVFP